MSRVIVHSFTISLDGYGAGPNHPYHTPTFVLTHHSRPPLEREGGTDFHFVTDGIRAATIRQHLEARMVDEMHIAVSPRLLGSGEPLFAGLDSSASWIPQRQVYARRECRILRYRTCLRRGAVTLTEIATVHALSHFE